MFKRYGWAMVAALLTVAADRLTKIWIVRNFSLYQSKEVVEGFFRITYLLNRGAAFGILSEGNAVWVRPFLVVVSLFAIFLIVYLTVITEDYRYLSRISLGLILGGAVGNLADRILQGGVVDFLDFYLRGHHWPPFNIADMAITVGVFIFLISQLILDK